MATADGFGRVWAGLVAQYPNAFKDVSPDILKHTYTQYARLTADLSDLELEAAALQHVAHCKWFPTVAELRDAILTISTHDEPAPEEAWGIATRRVRGAELSSYPLIQEAIRIMGSHYFSMRLEENEGVDRAHFFRIYETLRRRRNDNAMMLPEVREAARRLSAGGRLALTGKAKQ